MLQSEDATVLAWSSRRTSGSHESSKGEEAYVGNEFLEILPGLLDTGGQNDGLLTPVTTLQKVICLEQSGHPQNRECRPESRCIVP